MKRLVSAAALTLLLAGAALAQAPAQPGEAVAPEASTSAPAETGAIPQAETPGTAEAAAGESAPAAPETAEMPASVEACIGAAADLGSTAEEKSLTPEHADRLDALFSKMETLCDGQEYADAMAVAKDIQTMIDAN
jgi:hypothetical protein